MRAKQNTFGLLRNSRQLGPYAMESIRKVDRPTTLITDQWQRVDSRDIAIFKASSGEFGSHARAAALRGTGQRDPISAAYMDVASHLATMKMTDVAPEKAPIPDDPHILSRHIKRMGYFLGADVMGICRMPKSAVYKCDMAGNPIDIDYTSAVVIATEKEYRTVAASKGYDWIADPVSFQAYRESAMVAITMAAYIRRLGYRASAQYGVLWYQLQIPPLLLMAGMGEVCRAGVILNPFLGFNYKAAAVLTDLPLFADKPVDFGLQDFCKRCNRCARACPSQAISHGDKVMYNGYETWKLDTKRCASFVLLNKHDSWCNTCVKSCPWSRPHTWNHNVVRWAVRRSSLARGLAIAADTLLGLPRGHDDEKWWFDLEMTEGKVSAASQSSFGAETGMFD
jgi:ferredoxin